MAAPLGCGGRQVALSPAMKERFKNIVDKVNSPNVNVANQNPPKKNCIQCIDQHTVAFGVSQKSVASLRAVMSCLNVFVDSDSQLFCARCSWTAFGPAAFCQLVMQL